MYPTSSPTPLWRGLQLLMSFRLRALLLALLLPVLGFGQAPELGMLSSFAIFSAVGAISNVGPATHIMGDVGTNVGAFSGFSPEMISGQIHVADAVSAQGALQVQQSYEQLFNQPARVVLGPLLGNGQILTPDSYGIGSAASLTGNLIFDACNDPKAVFILKVGGAFSAAAYSNILLINGAKLSNIYWMIGGRADMATGAIFQGTILVDGAIGLGNAASFQGRVFSRSGAVTLYNNEMGSKTMAASPLPVELASFVVQPQGNGALIVWQTASEKNCAYFALERSIDGFVFTALGQIAGQGTSTQAHVYTWRDERTSAVAIVYYRLRQVDLDGHTSYSPLRKVTLKVPSLPRLQAYPNPSQTGQPLSIQFEAAGPGAANLRLSNTQGHLLYERTLRVETGNNTLSMPEVGALPTGVYLLQLQLGPQQQTQRILRQ